MEMMGLGQNEVACGRKRLDSFIAKESIHLEQWLFEQDS